MQVTSHGNCSLRDWRWQWRQTVLWQEITFSSQHIVTTADFCNYEKGNILKIPRHLAENQARGWVASLHWATLIWVGTNPDWVLALTGRSLARQSLCPEKLVKTGGADRHYQSRLVKSHWRGQARDPKEGKGEGPTQGVSRWQRSLAKRLIEGTSTTSHGAWLMLRYQPCGMDTEGRAG